MNFLILSSAVVIKTAQVVDPNLNFIALKVYMFYEQREYANSNLLTEVVGQPPYEESILI